MKSFFMFLLLAAGPMQLSAQTVDSDELAIRTVIERETQAYLDRNVDHQSACWADSTDLSQRISLDDGHIIAADGDHASLRRGLESCFRQLTEPDSSVFEHQHYKIRIRGGAAFVTFLQIMRCAGRPASYSQQVRYLEREAGSWKIIHSGVSYYDPTSRPAQASR
jgi:hypothetical protein